MNYRLYETIKARNAYVTVRWSKGDEGERVEPLIPENGLILALQHVWFDVRVGGSIGCGDV